MSVAVSDLQLRFSGMAADLSDSHRKSLLDRTSSPDHEVRKRVSDIISMVGSDGDRALFRMAADLDGAALEHLEVPAVKVDEALKSIDSSLRTALERAARNIERVHRRLLPVVTETTIEPGVVVGRRPDPLFRVGIYAPGGRAAYPSSVLMGAMPARVAGVKEVILCSPPRPDGLPSLAVLAAARIANVDRVFAIGGAGAIAAMALGTSSVPRVDKIVGPGNAYVAEAKLQLAGFTSFDSPAGPSELLVIADDSADAAAVAREVIAQAEHDPRASVLVLAIGERVAKSVYDALATRMMSVVRRDIVLSSLRHYGGILSVSSISEAIELSNAFAPEHLMIATVDAVRVLALVRNTGTVFVGQTSSVSFGDYVTGANHVLPTGGLARSYSGLSTLDFVRWTSYQKINEAGAASLAHSAAIIAEAEGLDGHAAAARAWETSSAIGCGPGISLSCRESLAHLGLYSGSSGDCSIDLSDNTSLWGPPPAAIEAIAHFSGGAVARYPSAYASDLKNALARYTSVDASMIVTGCGSDDVLDSAIRAFGTPGDRLAYMDPSFGMIPVFAHLNGLIPVPVALDTKGDIRSDELAQSAAAILYLCSPNNPTGGVLSRARVEEIASSFAGLVIVDQAYAEFGSEALTELVVNNANVLVTRTMSKAFGLASLRIGYGLGAEQLVREVEKSRGPYKVNAIAEAAALATLENGLPWVGEHVAEMKANRSRFIDGLHRIGLESLPTDANFVLVPTADAAALGASLRVSSIAVRVFDELSGIGSAIRITIGPWPFMEACLAVLGATKR